MRGAVSVIHLQSTMDMTGITLCLVSQRCLNHGVLFFLKNLNQQNKNSIEIIGRKICFGSLVSQPKHANHD